MPTFFRGYPKTPPRFSLLTIFWFPLMWLPAFGLLPDQAYTWAFMNIGIVLVALAAVFYLTQYRSKRAYLAPLIFGSLSFLTAVIYFARLTEYFRDEFGIPLVNMIILAIGLLGISGMWAFRYYRSLRAELELLRKRGLLRKYDILDEQKGLWNSQRGLPGLDGSSPEERKKADIRRASWLLLLPASGITFFLIRTWSGSVTWVLLAIDLGIYCLFVMGMVGLLPIGVQLLAWEKELDKPIIEAPAE